jgi:hypothetical protein
MEVDEAVEEDDGGGDYRLMGLFVAQLKCANA